MLLQRLLQSMEDPSKPLKAAVIYAALSLIVRQISAQSSVFSLWFSRRCYERSRGEMITILYEKTLSRKIVGKIVRPTEKDMDGTDTEEPPQESKTLKAGRNRLSTLFEGRFRAYCGWLPRSLQPTPGLQELKQPASMGKILNLMR